MPCKFITLFFLFAQIVFYTYALCEYKCSMYIKHNETQAYFFAFTLIVNHGHGLV